MALSKELQLFVDFYNTVNNMSVEEKNKLFDIINNSMADENVEYPTDEILILNFAYEFLMDMGVLGSDEQIDTQEDRS